MGSDSLLYIHIMFDIVNKIVEIAARIVRVGIDELFVFSDVS